MKQCQLGQSNNFNNFYLKRKHAHISVGETFRELISFPNAMLRQATVIFLNHSGMIHSLLIHTMALQVGHR